ncbi:MAG: hypothetical protein KGL95_01645 [Patescibacteria group bacterium]|nr:hypothetical protein [Patescibacteria group bacterium]
MGSIKTADKSLTNLLAQARALHFAMFHNAISQEDAQKKIQPMLQKLNQAGEQIAKKYKRKYIPITFQDLGKNF